MLDDYLKPEHTFLDLGAWVGSHSLYAARIAKRVISVEPDPVAFAILKKNVDFAHWPTEVYEGAISGAKGIITLGSGMLGASTTRSNPNAGGGIGPWEEGQTFQIWATTLRQFCATCAVENPLFIKMDVEGSEEGILEDVGFFEERRPILYLETHPWWWLDEASTRKRIEEISKLCTVIQN